MSLVTSDMLQPKIVVVRQALAEAERAIAQISDEQKRRTHETALSTLVRAIEVWSTTLAQQVIDGQRTFYAWSSYGDDLVKDASDQAGYVDWTARWSSALERAGNFSEALLAPLEAKVKELRGKLAELEKEHASWKNVRAGLESLRTEVPSEVADLYWGPDAEQMEARLSQLSRIVYALEAGVASLRTGKLPDFSGLGNPFVGAAGALAVIGIALSLAAALLSYFTTVRTVVGAWLAKQELECINTEDPGKRADCIKLRQLRNEVERPGVSVGAIIAGVVVVGAIAVGVVVYLRKRKAGAKRKRRRKLKEAA